MGNKSKVIDCISTIFATFFYSGKFPIAPGTVGSLATFALLGLVTQVLDLQLYELYQSDLVMLALILFLYVGGCWASEHYMKLKQKHDPGDIVIDEVVGQLVTLYLAVKLMDVLDNVGWHSYPEMAYYVSVVAFLFFRLFDITKPNIVKWADNLHHAHGVMLDDVFAGIFAAIATFVTYLCAVVYVMLFLLPVG